VLYNGVDLNLFHSTTFAHFGADDTFRIGCIANFNDLKDQITLIKAFELFLKSKVNDSFSSTKFRLSLLGTGELRTKCEKYISEHLLEKYVEWPEEMPHRNLPDYYKTLDLFVLPSFFEGFGCVYLEAAACGIPFMGCLGQGYSEYIYDDEKDKWLITPGNYVKLSELIDEYYNNPTQQHYRYTYDIDSLIKVFIERIKRL
jgi:glycosyltransferase involved in cell wall biosynthesis